jgi:uncharacterized RDD family membrane protein YckC
LAEYEYEDRLTITTPEGVELSLTLAGVGSRFISATVDAAIEGLLLIAGALVVFFSNGLGGGGNVAWAIYAVFSFAVFWGYDVAFEVLASGRTPGKRWNGIRVVRAGGQPIGFLASATRNLLRVIDWLPSFYLVGILSVLFSSKNQRLGDIVAGTVVMRERKSIASASRSTFVRERRPAEAVAGWDVSAVTADEVATVRSFLQRRSEIDTGARGELASTMAVRLRPKVAGAPPELSSEMFLELLVLAKSPRE